GPALRAVRLRDRLPRRDLPRLPAVRRRGLDRPAARRHPRRGAVQQLGAFRARPREPARAAAAARRRRPAARAARVPAAHVRRGRSRRVDAPGGAAGGDGHRRPAAAAARREPRHPARERPDRARLRVRVAARARRGARRLRSARRCDGAPPRPGPRREGRARAGRERPMTTPLPVILPAAGPPAPRRWRRWLVILAGAAVAARLLLWAALPFVLPRLLRSSGLECSWSSLSLSLLGGAVEIDDLDLRAIAARDDSADAPALHVGRLAAD